MNFPTAARDSVWGGTQQSTFYKPLVNFSCTKYQHLVFDGLHFEICSLRKSWKKLTVRNNWERMFLLNRCFWGSLNILNSLYWERGQVLHLKNVHAVSGVLLRPNLTVLTWDIMTFYLPLNTLWTTCLSAWTSVRNPRKAVLASWCLPFDVYRTLLIILGPPQWSRILSLFQDQFFSGGPQEFTWWAGG